MGSSPFVAMGAILSFFFPWEDTGPDTRETKEEQSDVKEVDNEPQDTKKKTPEVTSDAKVSVPKITEEALEEADYEVVVTHNDPSTLSVGLPRTPQSSFASLSSGQQLDDGFEVISQKAEDPTSLLSFDTATAAAVVESDDIDKDAEEEGSPIANLKSGVEALLTDLSASGPEKEEESSSTTTSSSNSIVVKEETSTTTSIVQEVQAIGEVQDVREETKTEETTDP